MNTLLDELQRLFNLREIIIAAHPNGDGDEELNFNGRSVARGITEDLVKEARVVFSHYSNATLFAAQARKRVVLIDKLSSVLPQPITDLVHQKAREIGAVVATWDGKSIRLHSGRSKIMRYFRGYIYSKLFYRQKLPQAEKVLRDLMSEASNGRAHV